MKTTIIKRLSLAVAFCLGGIGLGAQTLCDSTEIIFRLSHSDVDTTLAGNASVLSLMNARLNSITSQDGAHLQSIRIVGAASPEGPERFNDALSRRRALSLLDYFGSRGAIDTATVTFSSDYMGRNWAGLLEFVDRDADVPQRSDVQSIIASAMTPDSPLASDRALRRLKSLDGGRPYRYLYRRYFPSLRLARIYMTYDLPSEATAVGDPLVFETVDTLIIDEPADSVPVGCIMPVFSRQPRHLYMGLKTNMLYDALALPNIGAEFYVGRGWSVGANWMYGWWSRDSRHRYWRAYGGEVSVRRWLGEAASRKPLTGHHLGLYAGAVTYDFEFGGTGYMGGNPGGNIFDRCNYYGGIEYGYSLPVGRRLNIDFSIGIGYLGGKYQKYKPCESGEGYLWQSTHHIGWFGPTKAEISLVWLIGSDNFNRNK